MDIKELETKANAWVVEAIDLRHGSANDPEGKLRAVSMEDGIREVTNELVRVRQRADRVDFLMTQAHVARSRLLSAQRQADFEAEIKFSESTVNRDRTKNEYTSSLAIKSTATLDSFEEKRRAHEAKMAVSVVDDAYQVLREISRQLDSLRNDLRATIKSLQFESTLEH